MAQDKSNEDKRMVFGKDVSSPTGIIVGLIIAVLVMAVVYVFGSPISSRDESNVPTNTTSSTSQQ